MAQMPANQLPEEMEAVLRSEKKQGYYNSGVAGEFTNWLLELAEKLPAKDQQAMKDIAAQYGQASILERPLLWQECFDLLAVQPSSVWDKKNTLAQLPQEIAAAREALRVSIQYLKGVGPKRAVLFRRLGIYTVEDLLYYFPRDYEVRGEAVPIGRLEIGQTVSIQAKIVDSTLISTSRRLTILKVLVADRSGSINAVWFNQKHLQSKLVAGKTVMLFGKVERKYNQTELWVQDYEMMETGYEQPPRILPVYPSTDTLTQKNIRSMVLLAWEKYSRFLQETLPLPIVARHGFMTLGEALYQMHFPRDLALVEQARQRLAFEELLILQMAILSNRLPEHAMGIARPPQPALLTEFASHLAFPLTNAQKRVITQVFEDLEQTKPMTRLVQGDVGSGKTMVAAAALYKNALAGYQGALMAPTEILAAQHYQSLQPLFTKLGFQVALLTGDTGTKDRREILQQIQNGKIAVVIGTHALFQKDVAFANLALAVTDEQHRFGVMQRSIFQEKGRYTDTLVMTATPIPRTLAMTLYGDLDVSVIDEMPPGRQAIETYAVGYDKEARALGFVKKELDKGRQAYIVCPLVDESDKVELQAATVVAEQLQKDHFQEYSVGLLHGKLKPAEKDQMMQAFAKGEIKVLVATTVIEVGINVPNATMMMIRDAERFGLAQLHQLRGRVGRGAEQSYCILLHNAKSPVARERMKTMVSTTDGFVIAEADLRLRGAGEFFGTRQSGVTEMKIANLLRDTVLLEQARKDALDLLAKDDYHGTILAEQVRQKIKILNS